MSSPGRIASIDIFRALTMLLMIFVNDFWTLIDIPKWMGHAAAQEDRMGLSDWVFPGFLFIVGLSIPFAIRARYKKGDTKAQIFWHIIKRSVALIVMGFYMVNLENINSELLPFSKFIWQLLMATAIVLIWNIYPDHKAFKRIPQWVMQVLGLLILVFIGILYKGGTVEEPGWLQPHWWGILGIIGWAYLACATIYLLVGKRILLVGAFVLLFLAMNVLEFVELFGWKININLMVSASNHLSVMSGVLVTMLYVRLGDRHQLGKFLTSLAVLAVVLILFGLVTRPEWGISKIRATPSWTTICAGISILLFAGLFIIADLRKKTSWANLIGPAGRSTLTCYLVPYFYYPIMALIGIYLPEFLRTGMIGLVKSLLFAYLIIFITGQLERINIRLKI